MQAYLDNSATTVCEPGVVEKVVDDERHLRQPVSNAQ